MNATRTTLAAFAISGFMAAFAGVLFVHHQSGLGVAAFLPYESLNAFSMVVIGGLGSLSGALIGAFYVRGAQYFLPGNWALLASGAGLLLVLMILPGGIGAAIADVRDAYLRWVAPAPQPPGAEPRRRPPRRAGRDPVDDRRRESRPPSRADPGAAAVSRPQPIAGATAP